MFIFLRVRDGEVILLLFITIHAIQLFAMPIQNILRCLA